MRREILIRHILDEDLVGTHHVPALVDNHGAQRPVRAGLILLNAGTAPRAGNSDLYVYLGDRLASLGISVFRFDLPGLGDSSGDTPIKASTFWAETQQGRNDRTTLALIEALRDEFCLGSMFVGGLCAGVVPALHAAVHDPEGLDGVILLDPVFRLASIDDSMQPGESARTDRKFKSHRLRKIFSLESWLMYLTGQSRMARIARPLHPLLLRAQLRWLGHALFKNANIALVKNLHDGLLRGVSTLILVAESRERDFQSWEIARVVSSFPQPLQRLINLINIHGTNHILTAGNARSVVLDEVPRWINTITMCNNLYSIININNDATLV